MKPQMTPMTQIEKIKTKCGNGPRPLFFYHRRHLRNLRLLFFPKFICGFSIHGAEIK